VDIDNWRWAGVPFYLRTGKRLPTVFRWCTSKPGTEPVKESWQELPQNKLTIRLQPDEGVDIQILNKVPGLDHKHNLQTTKLDLSYPKPSTKRTWPMLMSVCCWKPCVVFRRCSCVAMKWKRRGNGSTPLPKPGLDTMRKTVSGGTWGPVASVAMITRDGRSWNEFE
jgi:glucose-6-phosphate 1-dehydrogenase